MNAYKVYHYWLIYREYLSEHKLDDDTLEIDVDHLIDFVDEQISTEDIKRYEEFIKEAY